MIIVSSSDLIVMPRTVINSAIFIRIFIYK